jgi:hypothetical protein|tara:strand:- start:4276 stop:4770 length:495 start_codon:yes stop_codon:yes gene_type:complete
MSKEFKGPLDYIDVASRIVEFRGKFPEGSLTQVDLQFLNFAGKDWVVYTAAAYRSPEDQNPGIGTAWEPVPGPTRFTKDSELQNAETAAWGRAMMASLAVDARKGIASSEEVRNRTVEMRDFVSEAAKAKTVEDLRNIYNEARQSNAPKDSLASITALADGFTE